MITFDKIVLIVPLRLISITDHSAYETLVNPTGETTRQTCKQQTPYLLYVAIDHLKKAVKIEFTSKILLEDAHCLINKQNIETCLQTIKQTAGIQFHNRQILENADVCLCHAAIDYRPDHTLTQLKKDFKQSLNNAKYYYENHSGGGFTVTARAKTARYRLTVYDKHKELNLASNKQFVDTIGDKGLKYYENTFRCELVIPSMKCIRTILNITDNKLNTVLHSEATPISEIWEKSKIKKPANHLLIKGDKLFHMTTALKYYNHDLALLQQELRSYIGRTPSPKLIQKYHQLSRQMQSIAT